MRTEEAVNRDGLVRAFGRSFLTSTEFARRAYAMLSALSNDEYRLREEEGTKALIEEVLPLATFLKHFEIPFRPVRCRHFLGSQNYDAQIRIRGPKVAGKSLERSYFVEVTSAVARKDYLIREALSRYGGVFVGDNIQRVGSKRKGDDKIVSLPELQDGGEDPVVKKAVQWTRKALAKKNSKSYPKPCILLVDVQPEDPLSIRSWSRLAEEVQSEVDRNRFVATFIVSWTPTNFVFRLEP